MVHDADRKDLVEIARDIERLSDDARAGKAKLDDLRGGTFTVTSVGNIGGLISTPVINHPEVGILGIGKVVKRPVFDAAGHIRPRTWSICRSRSITAWWTARSARRSPTPSSGSCKIRSGCHSQQIIHCGGRSESAENTRRRINAFSEFSLALRVLRGESNY